MASAGCSAVSCSSGQGLPHPREEPLGAPPFSLPEEGAQGTLARPGVFSQPGTEMLFEKARKVLPTRPGRANQLPQVLPRVAWIFPGISQEPGSGSRDSGPAFRPCWRFSWGLETGSVWIPSGFF